MKTLSALVLLSAVVAAPVFARDAGPGHHHVIKSPAGSTHHHVRAHHRVYVHGAYNQPNYPYNGQPSDRYDPDPYFQRQIDNFGFSGRDPSRIGGEDPNLHPRGR
jgi:hypothetical protein